MAIFGIVENKLGLMREIQLAIQVNMRSQQCRTTCLSILESAARFL
ncbi:hypothetical protein [Nostoc sp. MG11]|nr:hypothetical protein [Nostoc sp. MG11]